ncbi:MAG TPA: glycosyltransferase family 4 protein [bacterium]|nr:glycosyltransferase family 4 protein [bacterium]
MNVLVLATKYFGLGGGEAYTRMFAEAVAADGHRVDVLSLLHGEVTDRPSPGRYLGHQGRRSTPLSQAQFVGQAVRHAPGYDLIVCSHVALGPVAHILRRLYKKPYLIIGHGIEVWNDLGPRRQGALRRAAQVVTVSRFTARQVVSVHGVPEAKVSVVYPAVDPALLREAETADAPFRGRSDVTLLTIARLSAQERYKGCDAVISALPIVLSEAKAVRYIVAGDGDDLPRLRALALEAGVSAAVSFPGSIPRRGLPSLYRECDVFVMPSIAERRPGGWTGEGFGIVYIEAAAFGRPVVGGDGGGAPEAVQDGVTGYVVDGRDVRAVAATLGRLVKDSALREGMGAAGRRWVRDHFTFERFRRDAAAAVETASNAAT